MELQFHLMSLRVSWAVTKKEVLRTSSPIAIPDGGVIVTLNWFARAPPPIRLEI